MLLSIPFGALQVVFIFGAFVNIRRVSPRRTNAQLFFLVQWAARTLRMKSPILILLLIPCIAGASKPTLDGGNRCIDRQT